MWHLHIGVNLEQWIVTGRIARRGTRLCRNLCVTPINWSQKNVKNEKTGYKTPKLLSDNYHEW